MSKGFIMQSRAVGENAIQLSLGSALRFMLLSRAKRGAVISKLAKAHFNWEGKANVVMFPLQRIIKLEALDEAGTPQE